MGLTTVQPIHELAELTGLPKDKARQLVELITFVMVKALRSGQSIMIKGFGTFKPCYYYTRHSIKFTPAKELLSMVNERYKGPELKHTTPNLPPQLRNTTQKVPDIYRKG